jgi:hypothetical protein
MEVDVVLAGATMTYHSLPMADHFRRVSDTIPARNVRATSTSPNSLLRHRNALRPPH